MEAQKKLQELQKVIDAGQEVVKSTQDVWTQYKQFEQEQVVWQEQVAWQQQTNNSSAYNANWGADIDIAAIVKSVNE
jgi:uncharacterized protein YoxC